MNTNCLNTKINAFIERNEADWYAYLVENKPILRYSNNPVTMAAIDKILVSYATTINNKDILQRVSKYAGLNMRNYYKKQLKSNDEAVRLNVLQRTLLLELEFLVPNIEQHLRNRRHDSMEEYLLMLRVVSKYNRNLFLAHVYKPRVTFYDYEYKVLLSNIDDDYIGYFKDDFDQLPIRLKLALLDFLSLSTNLNDAYLSFYERLLESEYLEIRIRALKAISSFGMISNLKLYKPFADSSDWEERLMLAKILRFVTEEQAYTILQQFMYDSEWQVRKQAAVSLKGMPKGAIILKQIAEKNEDEYASDMAKQALELG